MVKITLSMVKVTLDRVIITPAKVFPPQDEVNITKDVCELVLVNLSR